MGRRASRLGRWSPIELEWAAQGVEWRREREEDRQVMTQLMLIAATGGRPPAAERLTGGRGLGETRMSLFMPTRDPRRRG